MPSKRGHGRRDFAPVSSTATHGTRTVAASPSERSSAWQLRLSRAAPLMVFVVLGAAIATVYGPGLRAPFVHDDGASIINNHSIVRLWPLMGSPGPLRPPKDLPTSGRPLVNASLALNYYFGQYRTAGYHLVNDIVHALTATLLWAFIRRVLGLPCFQGRWDHNAGILAFAIALLWAVHPLQTQSVEYVTQRTELLLGFSYIATMYASLRHLTAENSAARKSWLAIATLSCFAGMACKETMVTAPIMVALLDWTFFRGSARNLLRRAWPLYAALASSWLLLLALNIGGPRSASAGFQSGLPATVWWLTQCKVLVIYTKLVFWPAPLLMHYELPRLETLRDAWPWALPVAVAIIVTLILIVRRRPSGFLAAWFFLILAPTFIVPVVTEVAAERRMYLPLAALATFFVLATYRAVARLANRTGAAAPEVARSRHVTAIVLTAALPLATVYGAVGRQRVKVYLDNVAVWQSVLDAQPDNVVAQASLAEALDHAGRPDEALTHFRRALELAPDSYVTHHLAGTMLLGRGQPEEAIAHFRRVVELKPQSASALNNLGVALNAAGQRAQAITQYQRALEFDPDYPEAHNNLATALANQGGNEQAIVHFTRAVQLNPDYAGALKGLGIVLIRTGRVAEGVESLESAARLQSDPDTYATLAIAYANAQQFDKALSVVNRALELARSSGQTKLIESFTALRNQLQNAPRQDK